MQSPVPAPPGLSVECEQPRWHAMSLISGGPVVQVARRCFKCWGCYLHRRQEQFARFRSVRLPASLPFSYLFTITELSPEMAERWGKPGYSVARHARRSRMLMDNLKHRFMYQGVVYEYWLQREDQVNGRLHLHIGIFSSRPLPTWDGMADGTSFWSWYNAAPTWARSLVDQGWGHSQMQVMPPAALERYFDVLSKELTTAGRKPRSSEELDAIWTNRVTGRRVKSVCYSRLFQAAQLEDWRAFLPVWQRSDVDVAEAEFDELEIDWQAERLLSARRFVQELVSLEDGDLEAGLIYWRRLDAARVALDAAVLAAIEASLSLDARDADFAAAEDPGVLDAKAQAKAARKDWMQVPKVVRRLQDDHHDSERKYLAEAGIDAFKMRGMGKSTSKEFSTTQPQEIYDFSMAHWDPSADGLFVSCMNLDAIAVAQDLEEAIGKPVVTSHTVTLWRTLSLSGIDDPIEGLGRLLTMPRVGAVAAVV